MWYMYILPYKWQCPISGWLLETACTCRWMKPSLVPRLSPAWWRWTVRRVRVCHHCAGGEPGNEATWNQRCSSTTMTPNAEPVISLLVISDYSKWVKVLIIITSKSFQLKADLTSGGGLNSALHWWSNKWDLNLGIWSTVKWYNHLYKSLLPYGNYLPAVVHSMQRYAVAERLKHTTDQPLSHDRELGDESGIINLPYWIDYSPQREATRKTTSSCCHSICTTDHASVNAGRVGKISSERTRLRVTRDSTRLTHSLRTICFLFLLFSLHWQCQYTELEEWWKPSPGRCYIGARWTWGHSWLTL